MPRPWNSKPSSAEQRLNNFNLLFIRESIVEHSLEDILFTLYSMTRLDQNDRYSPHILIVALSNLFYLIFLPADALSQFFGAD